METNQEVTAQGKILHRSGVTHNDPLKKINLGDADVLWNACQGAPWDVDANAEYLGDATYIDHNLGVLLTDVVGGEGSGEVAWYREYDLTKSIHVKGTFLAGQGSGGELISIFCQCFTVAFNESADTVFIETYSFTSDVYFAGDLLSDNSWRTFEIIYEYFTDDERYVTVLINGKHICKVNIGQVNFTYPFVGIFALNNGQNNAHRCRSFEARSAEPWLNVYTPHLGKFDGSLKFDGSAYLTVGNSDDWALGKGDFTIEMFMKQTSTNNGNTRLFSVGSYPNASISISIEGSFGSQVMYTWLDGNSVARNIPDFQDTWVHVAICRKDGVLYPFVNGQLLGEAPATENVTNNSDDLYIGKEENDGDTTFIGYITNFNWIKGTALYTTSFNPPIAPLFQNVNSKLMLKAQNLQPFSDYLKNYLINNTNVVWSDDRPFV